MQNSGLGESQAGIKISGRNINRYANDGRKQRGTKELLDEGERWRVKRLT